MEHQEIGIATNLVLRGSSCCSQVLPPSAVTHDPDARGDIHLVGVQGINHGSAVHIVVHPRDHPEGAPIVGFQEATLLDADKHGMRVMGWNDVLRVRDVGRRRETPLTYPPTAGPGVPSSYVRDRRLEQMRRFHSGINARTSS